MAIGGNYQAFVMIMNFLKGIICNFKGHIPEPFLTENEVRICTKRCARCKSPLGLVGTFKLKSFVPPWCTQEEWDQFCEQKYQELRDSV